MFFASLLFKISAFLTIMLGIGFIVVFFIIQWREDYLVSTAKQQKKILCQTIMGLGIGFFILGILSILGAQMKKIWAFSVQIISAFIILIAILFLTVVILIQGMKYSREIGDDPRKCSEVEWFSSINHQIILAALSFCKLNCPCNADKSMFPIITQLIMITSIYGPYIIQDCPFFKETFKDQLEYTDYMQLIETFLNCTGICTQIPYHVFADVRNGVPESSCGTKLMTNFNYYWRTATIIGFSISLLLILNVIFCLVVFCKRKIESESREELLPNGRGEIETR